MATMMQALEFAIGLRDQASAKLGKLRGALAGLGKTTQSSFEQIGTGVMGVAGAGYSIHQMVAPAIDLNRAMGEVASLDVDAAGLAALQDEAKQFAMDYGGTAAEVIRSSYDIQSAIAGLSGKELGRFTVASGVLAKATKADVGTITSYMGTMYGIFKKNADGMGKAQWVEQVAGQTALAVKVFKTKGTEMSAAFTALGANAAAAGRDAAEQMAVLGTLQSTMSGSEAGTKYKAFLNGVGQAQKELGLKFTDAKGNMLGMVEILNRLKGTFGDSLDVAEGDKLKKAFGSDEAVSLIKQLMTDTEGLATNIDALGKIKGMDGARSMAAHMTDAWGQLGGTINALGASFGQALLPPLEDVVRKGTSVLQTLNRWITIAPNLTRWVGYGAIAAITMAGAMGALAAITAIGKLAMLGFGGPLKLVLSTFGLLTKITYLQTAAQWLFNAALWANPMTWVVAGIIAAIAVVGALIYWWDDLKAALLDTAWAQAILGALDTLMGPFKALGDTWDSIRAKFTFGTAPGAPSAVAGAAVAPPAPPAPLPALDDARVATPPAGGIMRASHTMFSRSNTRQTTIGSVTINTQQPVTPGLFAEHARLGAG